MLRTFLAVELPADIREALVQHQQALQRHLPAASWLRPDALHITVKFLGDTPHEYIDTIKDSVRQGIQGMKPFVIDIEGLGVFPNPQVPRILWAGVTVGAEQFLSVMKQIEGLLVPLGFPKEGKSLHPHVTLARIKKEHKRFGVVLNQGDILTSSMKFGSVEVQRLTLFQSELRSTGSVYTQLWNVCLT